MYQYIMSPEKVKKAAPRLTAGRCLYRADHRSQIYSGTE